MGSIPLHSNAFPANPAREDVTVAQVIEEFAFQPLLQLIVAFVAQAHEFLVLPSSIEMGSTPTRPR